MNIVETLISRPFGYVLRLIFEFIGSYGLSIVIFTLLTKIIILPFSIKTKQGMMQMNKLQPKLAALQKQYGSNKQKYQEEVAKLYSENNVNPLGTCLPTMITFPIMIGLYYVINRPLSYIMGIDAQTISNIAAKLGLDIGGQPLNIVELGVADLVSKNFAEISSFSDKLLNIDLNFLGINLSKTPQWNPSTPGFEWALLLIPIFSGLTAYAMTYVTTKMQVAQTGVEPMQQNKMLNYMMPLMSVWFGFILPAGVGLYWIASNAFAILQEYLLSKYFISRMPPADNTPKKKKPPVRQISD